MRSKHSISKVLHLLLKAVLFLLVLPIGYVLVALILSLITVNGNSAGEETTHHIFITSNGVHLDIIIPRDGMTKELIAGLDVDPSTQYFAFGWGDQNFYLHTQPGVT